MTFATSRKHRGLEASYTDVLGLKASGEGRKKRNRTFAAIVRRPAPSDAYALARRRGPRSHLTARVRPSKQHRPRASLANPSSPLGASEAGRARRNRGRGYNPLVSSASGSDGTRHGPPGFRRRDGIRDAPEQELPGSHPGRAAGVPGGTQGACGDRRERRARSPGSVPLPGIVIAPAPSPPYRARTVFPRSTPPPFDTPSLTVATPPSSSQVLLVMKDSARSTPAKKLLEDIGYKGASTAPRATRRDRGSSACTFLEGGLVPRSRFFFPSGHHAPGARARAGRIAPRAPPAPAPRRRAPDRAPGTPRRPIARARRSQPGNARAPSPPPARADRGIARRAANRRIRGGIFWVTTRDEPTTVHDPSNKTLFHAPLPVEETNDPATRRSDPIPDPFSDAHRDPPPFSFAFASRS